MKKLLTGIALIGVSAMGAINAQTSTTLALHERAGVSRTHEGLAFGVPIPRSWAIKSPAELGLKADGATIIPAQFEILARWGGAPTNTNCPAKWVLVSIASSVNANGRQTIVLEKSPSNLRPKSPGL